MHDVQEDLRGDTRDRPLPAAPPGGVPGRGGDVAVSWLPGAGDRGRLRAGRAHRGGVAAAGGGPRRAGAYNRGGDRAGRPGAGAGRRDLREGAQGAHLASDGARCPLTAVVGWGPQSGARRRPGHGDAATGGRLCRAHGPLDLCRWVRRLWGGGAHGVPGGAAHGATGSPAPGAARHSAAGAGDQEPSGTAVGGRHAPRRLRHGGGGRGRHRGHARWDADQHLLY